MDTLNLIDGHDYNVLKDVFIYKYIRPLLQRLGYGECIYLVTPDYSMEIVRVYYSKSKDSAYFDCNVTADSLPALVRDVMKHID